MFLAVAAAAAAATGLSQPSLASLIEDCPPAEGLAAVAPHRCRHVVAMVEMRVQRILRAGERVLVWLMSSPGWSLWG